MVGFDIYGLKGKKEQYVEVERSIRDASIQKQLMRITVIVVFALFIFRWQRNKAKENKII